jgi:hypothetical protein
MYPYLPGRAWALTTATVMSDRDIAAATAARAADRGRGGARIRARRDTAAAVEVGETRELHRWLAEHVSRLHPHKRPPAMP